MENTNLIMLLLIVLLVVLGAWLFTIERRLTRQLGTIKQDMNDFQDWLQGSLKYLLLDIDQSLTLTSELTNTILGIDDKESIKQRKREIAEQKEQLHDIVA